MIQKSNPLRSRKHLMVVASLPCSDCGVEGFTQAAHANFGKGLATKACDSQTFPLCLYCHTSLDQSGRLDKEERRRTEATFVQKTRQLLISRCLWSKELEAAYIRADKYKVEICEHK